MPVSLLLVLLLLLLLFFVAQVLTSRRCWSCQTDVVGRGVRVPIEHRVAVTNSLFPAHKIREFSAVLDVTMTSGHEHSDSGQRILLLHPDTDDDDPSGELFWHCTAWHTEMTALPFLRFCVVRAPGESCVAMQYSALIVRADSSDSLSVSVTVPSVRCRMVKAAADKTERCC